MNAFSSIDRRKRGRGAAGIAMLAVMLGIVLFVPSVAVAQARAIPARGVQAAAGPTTGATAAEWQAKEKLNAWTVGLAGGQLEGAPIRLATEIGRVVDDGDNLHVLPIVTRGPVENVEDLLYLRGIDAAIISTDALDAFRTLVPNIDQRISYILNLFPSELHIFVRPDIRSLDDLRGKKVNFNTPGTAAAYSGPLIFKRLHLDVEKTFVPHQVVLEQMRAGQGDIAAVVFITSKPVDSFLRGHWQPGFKFLPVEMEDYGFYIPSVLTSKDYPELIPDGQSVPTIAIPTVLAAYNWPKNNDRYKRVARLTERLFSHLDELRQAGFHPKWKDVNPEAKVPGLTRFAAAQEWIDAAAAEKAKPAAGGSAGSAVSRASVIPQRPAPPSVQQFLEEQRKP